MRDCPECADLLQVRSKNRLPPTTQCHTCGQSFKPKPTWYVDSWLRITRRERRALERQEIRGKHYIA